MKYYNSLNEIEAVKKQIIDRFKSGKATEIEWKAMADAVFFMHNNEYTSFVRCIFNNIKNI